MGLISDMAVLLLLFVMPSGSEVKMMLVLLTRMRRTASSFS